MLRIIKSWIEKKESNSFVYHAEVVQTEMDYISYLAASEEMAKLIVEKIYPDIKDRILSNEEFVERLVREIRLNLASRFEKELLGKNNKD